MKKLSSKQIRNIEFKNLNIGKDPIVFEYDTVLSANKNLYEELYNVSASAIQDIAYNGLMYCDERLSGTYNFSGDSTFEKAPVNVLQENKTVLKHYMLKYYLLWNEGNLASWDGFNVSGMSGTSGISGMACVDYTNLYKIYENNPEIISEINSDINTFNLNTVNTSKSMLTETEQLELEYNQFISTLRKELIEKKSLSQTELFELEYKEFIEELKRMSK